MPAGERVLSPLCGTQTRYTTYCGTFAHTPVLDTLEVLPYAAVGVNSDGTIDFVVPSIGSGTDLRELTCAQATVPLRYEEIDIVDHSHDDTTFFFPGFVDTHIHAPQFPNNGIFGNTTLLEWLEEYTFPLEASFTDLAFAREVYTTVVERTLSNGTTTASYYATIHSEATKLLADLCLQLGQRAFVGKVCMNENSPPGYIETEEQCQRSTLAVIDHIKGRDPKGHFVRPVLTPRFAGSCSDGLMKWLGKLRVAGDYHCQTHLSENHAEIEWITSMFPQYKNYTDIYLQTGLLGPRTTLAHCIHLTDEEVQVLAHTGAGVSHCPTSNSSITSGEARVRWLLDNGVNVSLGTDCSGGFSASILEVARHALLVSRHLVMKTGVEREKLSSAEVLYLATVGGARVLKMDHLIGSFRVGLKFDAQLVKLRALDSNVDVFDFQRPQWGVLTKQESIQRFSNLVDKWLFNGDNRNVVSVFVNGRKVTSRV